MRVRGDDSAAEMATGAGRGVAAALAHPSPALSLLELPGSLTQ